MVQKLYNKENNEMEVNIKELIAILLGKAWIIIMTGIGLALIGYLLSVFILTPQYQSSTKIYLLNKQDESSAITYADLQTGSQLTKDYMTLVSSRPVIEQVITELNLDMSNENLVSLISVTNPIDTRILNIMVEYEDPFIAKQIADAVREAAAIQITKVMNIDKINIVEEANIPKFASSPNVMRNSAIGGILGVFLAVFIILLIHMSNDRIKTPDDVERYLGLSTLCSIPIDYDKRKDRI